MPPVTPAPHPARPQKSTAKKSPGWMAAATTAAHRSANANNDRFKAMRARRNALFPNGPPGRLALPVTKPTKPGLRQSAVKDDNQSVQLATTGRILSDFQPTPTSQSRHPATRIAPQLDGSTLLGNAESLSSAVRTPVKKAAAPKKPLRVYQNATKRQALERRDIYQLPADGGNEHNSLFEEPRTSSFQYPSDEPAPASQESETLEQCLRRSIHTQQALDEARSESSDDTEASVLEEESDEEVEEDEEDDDQADGQEDGNGIEDEAHSNIRSQSEPLTELELEILQLGEPARPSTSPSISPKRTRPSARSESPDYHEIQAHDADDESENENDEILRAPSPKKRRCRTNPVKAVRSEALQTLTTQRKSKSASKPRQSTGAVKKSKQSENPKKPHRLPVDELVTVSQRFDDDDLEEHSSPPLELSQDPISQVSDGESEVDLRIQIEVPIKFKIPRRALKGFGQIDRTKFRVPDSVSPHRQRRFPRTPSYSDGFEGKEAEPIGRLMPMKGLIHWKEAQRKVIFKPPQLVLVSEKPSSPTKAETRPRRKKKKRQTAMEPQAQPKEPSIEKKPPRARAVQPPQLDNGPRPHPQVAAASVEQQHRRMEILEQTEVGEGPDNGLRSENQTDVIPSIKNHDSTQVNEQLELRDELNDYLADPAPLDPFTPKRLSNDEDDSEQHPSTSHLKRKQQIKHLSQPVMPTKESGDLNHNKLSQAVSNIASTPKKTMKQAKADFEAMYELSMVSVKRRHLSDYEEESQSDYEGEEEEEEEDHEDGGDDNTRRDESQLLNSDSVYEESECEEEAADDGLDLATQQEYDQDDMGLEVEEDEQPSKGNGIEQDDDKLKFLEDTIMDDTSGEQLNMPTNSRQSMARQALGQLDQDPRTHIDPRLRTLPQGHDILRKNQHSECGRSHKSQRHKSSAPKRWDDGFDSSWRPKAPTSSSLETEVDDEIYDSPTQPLSQSKAPSGPSRSYNARQRSRIASRPLPLGPSRPQSPVFQNTDRDSQGSVILGSTQNFVLPISVPETQFSNDGEEPRSPIYDAPSYFSQASRSLSGPVQRHQFSRTKSTPARVHFAQAQAGTVLLTPSAMFVQTISPVKSAPTQRLPTLREEIGTPSQSLRAITRRVSSSMGTQPAGSRRRMQSAVYNPPFLKSQDAEGARA
ncbi:uncharacterized protein PAC_14862 [Phialocephala subalpina]|uniref:Uncharacterized protein n=1 Tax=Phialocephala subalpina TaxID=576137 RepID=A0A1L7XIU8_9HELO|nr:uncharacterized protein PAC_14862 [Phialocephala subalpina]